nr:hypothetical protein [Tanacetum cinerariifolium]
MDTALKRRVENLELDKISQALEITKLKQRVKKLERRNKLKEGIIKNIDAYEDFVLEDAKDVDVDAKDNQDVEVLSMQDEEESKPIKLQEVVDVVTTTKIITAASTTITAADVPTPATTTAVALTLIAAPSRRRKRVVIRDPKESTTTSTIIHSEAKTKDKDGLLQGMYYDDIHPIFEKHFDSNMAFLQKTKEQMDEEDSKALKRLNVSKAKKAAKKQKLDEEVKELKRHLQIVPNDDDDVYIEVTPLARKVLVVDYEIYNENNKPYFKIKRADGTHQLYISFLSMLKNFDREDLEVLWQLVKERFATANPKNFSDDFLLMTLGAISVHGQVKVKSWKLLESCGVQIITFITTQLILLVERRYPLTRFTLSQMLNNLRLEVEEESEVSLEIL